MEPIDYTGALRRSWRLLVALAILVAIIAVLLPVGKSTRPKGTLAWEANAVVGSVPGSQGSPLGGGVTSAQIYFFANSSTVQGETLASAGLKVFPFQYFEYLSAAIVAPGTTSLKTTASTTPLKRNSASVVLLTAHGKTSTEAVVLAAKYTVVLADAVAASVSAKQQAVAASGGSRAANSANSSDSGSGPVYTGYQVEQSAGYAVRTGAKASLGSSRKVRGLAGLVIGLVIGAVIVLVRELLDKRLRNSARAESNFGFPVVVEIPAMPVGPGPARNASALAVDVVREPDSPGAEAYRMLRMSVLFESLASNSGPTDPYGHEYGQGVLLDSPTLEPVRRGAADLGQREVVMVVSAGTEPSRPHVAANLAAIYGEAGQRVVVISTGDIEAGSAMRPLGPRSIAITRDDVQAQLQPSRLDFVSRLPLGSFVANSGELVTRGRAVLDVARTLCDVVIVEVPPMLAVHHAEALSRGVDVVLVVGECGFTTFGDARRAGDLLRRIDAPVLGVVLTNVRIDQRDVRMAVPRRPVPPPSPPEPEADEREMVLALGAGSSPGGPSTSSY